MSHMPKGLYGAMLMRNANGSASSSRRPGWGEAPKNYIAGRGRGASGFMTGADVGPAFGKDSSLVAAAAAASSSPSSQAMGQRKRNVANFGVAPAGYIPGAGRGSGGFGETKPGPLHQQDVRDRADYSEGNFDVQYGYNTPGLFDEVHYDEEDKNADETYEQVEAYMDGRRKRRREAAEARARKRRPKISDQFSDLKQQLSQVSASSGTRFQRSATTP